MNKTSSTLALEYTHSVRSQGRAASLVTNLALIVGGTLLLTLLAQVVVPMVPVPITGQSLGVLLIGAALGMRRAVASVLLYLGIGAAGVPVFAGGVGIATLLGPTGGYLWSFVAAAAVVGFLSERQWDRKFAKALVAFFVGHLIIFAIGVTWLACMIGIKPAIASGLVPFIPGMLIKTLIATSLLPVLWAFSPLGHAAADEQDQTAA